MIYSLCFKADLVGCHDLQLTGGFDHPNQIYNFKIECQACGGMNSISVKLETRSEQLKCKCNHCRAKTPVWAMVRYGKPHNRLGMPNVPDGYTEMMRFEIFGAKPFDYTFGGGWEVQYHGKIFRGLDLSNTWIPLQTDLYTAYDGGASDGDYPNSQIEIRDPVAMFFKVQGKEVFKAAVV